MAYGFIRKNKKYGLGDTMKKDNGSAIKVPGLFKSFIDNTRSTRRSKIVGTDEELLSQKDTCDLIAKYFKEDSVRFQELIKFKEIKNV